MAEPNSPYRTKLSPDEINLALLIGVLKFLARDMFPTTETQIEDAVNSGVEFVKKALPRAQQLGSVE